MEGQTYTIEFADGKALENITMNGNNYVSQVEITEDDFTDLSSVTITDEEGHVEELGETELVKIMHYSDGWYFILHELCPEEISRRNMEAQTFYTAMMTDTLIEEE